MRGGKKGGMDEGGRFGKMPGVGVGVGTYKKYVRLVGTGNVTFGVKLEKGKIFQATGDQS